MVAFLLALLTGMGVGSGGLFVVYLTVMQGVPQLHAQGLNLYFFIFSTATALIVHAKTNRLPLKRLLLICAVGGVGCILGALLAKSIDPGLLRSIFAFLLIVCGGVSLLPRKRK